MDRPTSPVVPSDSVGIAVMLDELVRKLRYYRTPDHRRSPQEPDTRAVSIPLGLSPESPAALESVLGQVPSLMLLDGYNIAGGVSEDLVGVRQGRDAAIRRAESVKRASPSTDVLVVFDASGASGRGDFVTDGGVRVAFEPLTSADDAIVALVRSAPPGCVVITNDRELQNRVAAHGAVVLFSTALLAWSEHLNTE
jgi:predicted RNA-binding protein with PIN domain